MQADNEEKNTSADSQENATAPIESVSSEAASGVPPGRTSINYKSEVGETLLNRALDLVSSQLSQMRELHAAARYLSEDSAKERRNLLLAREEIDYRLRYLEKKSKENKPATYRPRTPAEESLTPEELEKRRLNLLDSQQQLEHRERELAETQNDADDAAKRLTLLVRQFEIAGSQLTRSNHPSSGGAGDVDNPWELVLRAQLVQGQEEERGRLAREIHDGPAQVLANAVMRLEHSVSLLKQNRSEVQKELYTLIGVMRESLFEVRRFMFNLQPRTLVINGLNRTLQEYCADFANQYALEIDIDLPDFSDFLSEEQAMAAFRIVQECLQNVRKHSEGRRVHIYGTRDEDGLISIIIRDDGKGFIVRTAELGLNRGAGIPGMRERAELAGGKVSLRSTPGMGTEVTLRLRPATNPGAVADSNK
jgi:two-component system sensor histidine kinase DegS